MMSGLILRKLGHFVAIKARMLRAAIIGAAMALALWGPASSGAWAQSNAFPSQQQQIISNPQQLVPNFDTQNVIPLLQELGFQYRGVSVQLSNGEQRNILIAGRPNGRIFQIVPAACSLGTNRGCRGLSFVALFKGDISFTAINQFNAQIPFVSTGMGASGEAFLSRYDIADYGIPRGNFAVSLYNFMIASESFAKLVSNTSQTVSLDTFTTDMAANSLNRRALVEAGFEMQALENAAQAHAAEDHNENSAYINEVVEMLLKAEKDKPQGLVNILQ